MISLGNFSLDLVLKESLSACREEENHLHLLTITKIIIR